ncbi:MULTISPECIES: hypothetical protein [Cupriavidus]|uniref:DUF465 domain-containing protein n=1 Tax=Cupriavidus pauculus TaxID=82633 RepID=A0A3G8H765_9BURK|nr:MULTISPECIES: hypothetical protein [Cupriavidus]AZG16286.1 hypothetical protein EHF44_23105 [Cupriavidus pauculus]MDT6963323.1 hypothetical protein [Cupriavidus sp. SZY C1]
MQKGKTLRDVVILDRYIAEREAELQRLEQAARAQPGGDDNRANPMLASLRQAIYVLRARREVLGGTLKGS